MEKRDKIWENGKWNHEMWHQVPDFVKDTWCCKAKFVENDDANWICPTCADESAAVRATSPVHVLH